MTKTKLAIALALASAAPSFASASDHDDGLTRDKSRNRNITDVYAFREDNQTGLARDAGNLIVIMNSNPKTPGGRQEYFDPSATYDFHFSQLASRDKNSAPTGKEDLTLSLQFSAPDASGHQSFKVMMSHAATDDLQAVDNKGALTTTLAESKAGNVRVNRFRSRDGHSIDIFAGLREDPFFFDVDQFFKVRNGALRRGPRVGFRNAAAAVDFTVGLNVNTIVARIPIAFLAQGKGARIFDHWQTISADGKQIERLARPAINEGLITTNAFLNAFNMIPPSADFSAAAAPVRTEAVASLIAFDRIDGKIDIPPAKVVAAFLPDVMRIDTALSIPVGKTAYNAALSGSRGILIGGRKLEDDVMDITLSLLVAGDPTGMAVKDNVSYRGTFGNLKQGHSKLWGQRNYNGAAKFPFLAIPN